MTVTIYKNIKATASGFHRSIHYVLDRIREGKSLHILNQIRLEKDSAKRNELKQQLPSICFSGTFRNRAANALINHSGIICLDFDKFPDADELKTWRDTLMANEYVYSLFTSPSGDGLKVLVKIPPEKESHKAYFDALNDYFDCKYFDIACSDVSRVCYESYDKDLYLNEDSLTWTKKEDNQVIQLGDNNPSILLKSSDKIINNLLTWWKSKFGLSANARNHNVFKLAIAFNDFGVDKNEAERTLSTFVEKDFTEREILNIVKSAYKNSDKFGTKFFEDKFTKEKIEKLIRAGKSVKEIKEAFTDLSEQEIESATNNIKDSLQITEFWQYSDQGKLTLRPHKFKEYLEQQGFCKIFPSGSENYIFVKVEENLIDNTLPSHIKDHTLLYLYNSPEFGIAPYDFIAGTPKYFKEDYLSLITTEDVAFKEDTEDKCYLYYKNCAIEITKNEVKEIDYLELQGFVWKKQIIDREYKVQDHADSVYRKFLWLISGQIESRFDSLRSVIGYLLHSYKDSSANKAIILNDEVISENPNGGSGKGIFCNAINKIKNVATIDGKQFDFNKSFPYQTVGADTQVLVFDDVKKNFAFENLFSLVTEGITLEKKNKDAIKLPVSKSPKIVITTNYTVGGMGGSFERRKFEVELSAYFGVHHTPLDEFKHTLFDEWGTDEWLKFENFMIECVQYYLANGLVKYESNNLETKKFIKETSHEFYEYASEVDAIPVDFKIIKRSKYEEFLTEYPDCKKWLSQKRFSQWIDSYAKFKGLKTRTGKDIEGRWVEILSGEEPKTVQMVNYYEKDEPF